MAGMACEKCGAKWDSSADICLYCGTQRTLHENVQPQSIQMFPVKMNATQAPAVPQMNWGNYLLRFPVETMNMACAVFLVCVPVTLLVQFAIQKKFPWIDEGVAIGIGVLFGMWALVSVLFSKPQE